MSKRNPVVLAILGVAAWLAATALPQEPGTRGSDPDSVETLAGR